jgi:hypothetical protein
MFHMIFAPLGKTNKFDFALAYRKNSDFRFQISDWVVSESNRRFGFAKIISLAAKMWQSW